MCPVEPAASLPGTGWQSEPWYELSEDPSRLEPDLPATKPRMSVTPTVNVSPTDPLLDQVPIQIADLPAKDN